MAGERKAIRDAISGYLQSLVSFPVYSGRSVDGRDLEEFINVYFTDGDSIVDGLQSRTEANVIVSYRTVDELTDDQLDEKSEPLVESIESHDFGGVMMGVVYSGFEYLDERERGFDGVSLRFTVIY